MAHREPVKAGPEITIKGLKTWNTHDGGGYQFTVYMDGQKAFYVHNDGNGGSVDFETDHRQGDPKLLKAFEDFVDALPLTYWDDPVLGNLFVAQPGQVERNEQHDRHSKMEIYVAGLLEDYENRRKFTRICRTKTVVQLTTDPTGTYRVYARPFTPEFERALREKLGATLVEFINLKYPEVSRG